MLSFCLVLNNIYNSNSKNQALMRVSCLFAVLKKYSWQLHPNDTGLFMSGLLFFCLFLKSKLCIRSWFNSFRSDTLLPLHFSASGFFQRWLLRKTKLIMCLECEGHEKNIFHLYLQGIQFSSPTKFLGLSLQTGDTKKCILFHLLAA